MIKLNKRFTSNTIRKYSFIMPRESAGMHITYDKKEGELRREQALEIKY